MVKCSAFSNVHTRPKEMTEVIDNQENRFIEKKKQKQQQIKNEYERKANEIKWVKPVCR